MGKEHALAKQKYKNCREKTHKRCARTTKLKELILSMHSKAKV
jgi:hypothetical protein